MASTASAMRVATDAFGRDTTRPFETHLQEAFDALVAEFAQENPAKA